MIPSAIVKLMAEATSNHSDGFTKEVIREELIEIRDYTNKGLGETYTCDRCRRELVVFQHLDHIDTLKEGIVCMLCLGGS